MKYDLLCSQLEEFLLEESWYASALSNASALLMDSLPYLNWAGFYLMRGGQLVVGPFQGKPACIHISVGKGVCGTAAERNETILVEDVHDFPGHIACDSASNSEIVVPIHGREDSSVIAVLDIDSPELARFTSEDKDGLERFVSILERYVAWNESRGQVP